jgi:ribonuclease HI
MIVHTDGSCWAKDGRMGVGIAFFENDSDTPFREEAITISGLGSSNEAEYHGIIHALMIILKEYDTPSNHLVTINTDSQLICNQIIGDWECRHDNLKLLLDEVWRLVRLIKKPLILFNWVPRENSKQRIVDKLSKQANLYFQEKCVNLKQNKQ